MGCWRDWMLLKRLGLCCPVCRAFLYLYPALHSAVPSPARSARQAQEDVLLPPATGPAAFSAQSVKRLLMQS